jgi:hypothetical protein
MNVQQDLRAWRTERLRQVKQSAAYQNLDPILKRIVDHMVRKYESREEGIFVRQAVLAERFGVCRQTMNRYLDAIVEAGVFEVEPRWRSGLGQRGRTTNRYRLRKPVLLSDRSAQCDTECDTECDTICDSGSTSSEVQVEAPTEQIEAALCEQQLEGDPTPPREVSESEEAGLAVAGQLHDDTQTIAYTDDQIDAALERRAAYDREARAALGRRRKPDEVVKLPWLRSNSAQPASTPTRYPATSLELAS